MGPGERVVDGRVLYSAAWLSEDASPLAEAEGPRGAWLWVL